MLFVSLQHNALYLEILFLSKKENWLFKIIESKEGDNRKFD